MIVNPSHTQNKNIMVLAADILPVKPVRYTYADRLFIRWVDQSDWSNSMKRVCLKLFEQQRKYGQTYLFHRTLAEWLGLSIATVKRALHMLSQMGVLEIAHQIRYDGGYGSNRYKVIPRIPEDIALISLDPTRKTRERGATATPVPDQNELAGMLEKPCPTRDSEAQNPATEKKIIQKEINNSSSNDSLNGPCVDSLPNQVVVSNANASNPKNPPTGENRDTPSWLLKRLRQIGTQDTIDRIIGWYKACPANHPSRPKHPAAWIYTGVREDWQEPPSWIKQAPPTPPVQLRILTEEEVARQEAARLEAQAAYHAQKMLDDQEWAAIDVRLQADTQEAQEFRERVHAHLLQQLGKDLGSVAWASQGPTWQNACREIWRNLADAQKL